MTADTAISCGGDRIRRQSSFAAYSHLIVTRHYRFSNCAVTATSEITCVGNLGTMFYSAEFSCAALDGALPGAVAVLGQEDETCLGDTPTAGTWVHGIQLFLMCEDEASPIGICEPEEANGTNNACSLGFTCAEGGCTAETLTIPDIISTIESGDCSITMSPTASPAPSTSPTAAESAVPTVSLAPSGAPTTMETVAPTTSAAPSGSPAPTVAPTSTTPPTESPAPSVAAVETTMPTGAAIPTNNILPTETGAPPTEAGAIPTAGAPEEGTTSSGSSITKVTVASMLAATVLALVGYF